MAGSRRCEQCGTSFTPRREHARFCSGPCRVAWGRARLDAPGDDPSRDQDPPSASALQWSVSAMSDLMRQLPAAACGTTAGRAVISEAVWQVTMVDATLVRYHPEAYDRVLAARPTVARGLVEGTLAGLRFVRNRMRGASDRAAFISCRTARGAATLTWRPAPVPESSLAALLPPAREWAVTRYESYQEFLVGQPVAETFARAAGFLTAVAAAAPAVAPVSEETGR
jgi:hypothetical protein